jgi:hypothetical protein
VLSELLSTAIILGLFENEFFGGILLEVVILVWACRAVEKEKRF